AANAACREPASPVPFNAGIAATSEFPWKLWCRLQARAASQLGPVALQFADTRGLPSQREAIARYLAQFRGIRCAASQVMIFNSAQQALTALSILLLDRGDAVWIEDPCYLGVRAAFELAGATLVPVPVDAEGLRVEDGIHRAPRARMAYVTPPHQYPTGVALSLERRIALLEWAARNGSWIVEDDYDGEFRYGGPPLASLYSLDANSRVLYLGTLNKSTFVSLRLAYVVIPETLVEPLANIRTQLDGFTPALTQMAMSLFMEEGYFASHLRRMRAVYGAKRALLIESLAPLAQRGWSWSNNPAGMHLLVRHSNGERVRAVARASSLDLALLSSYRIQRAREDGLFLRFGALDTVGLEAGAATLVADATKSSC
ncbi:MAG TPA: PLP-dependent aminotransferase family protein, partial [Terriglobia bacterium]|nr:PLP-dependent aminotransferase family protein [Terriglobia bacterium]